MTKDQSDFTTVLHENRKFKPPVDFAKNAHIKNIKEYEKLYKESIRNPKRFWDSQAKRELQWQRPWKKTLEWKEPHAKWFVGGKINVTENCIDRHISSDKRHKAAIIWEGESGEVRTLTYQQMHDDVCRFANVLKSFGVKTGDRVTLYMPLIPELAVSMLACARIGAVHTVVFGGFSSTALRDRILDSGSEIVVTADGGYRKGELVPLKKNVDDALQECPHVKTLVVYQRTKAKVDWQSGRDHWWHECMQKEDDICKAAVLDSEHPLYILYTSGTTGKPKGLLHTTAGYLLGATLTSKLILDIKETDLYWCTADIGWVTGHSYVVYGPLSLGASIFMYEGAPNFPEPDRFWKMIAKHKINILYTAPTAIRAFMKWGDHWPDKHDLSSLRLLGSVGEPINPEAWIWYHNVIGKKKCPIVDTWWQTETGAMMIAPFPGATATKPGSCTRPFFGVEPILVNKDGKEVKGAGSGLLCIKKPWPSMARTIHGDAARYKKTYWSDFKGCYFTGDGARRDKDGYFWIMGRVDDVLNVSGHRLGTMEVESALVQHHSVAEAAVVGKPHDIKGQAIVAFVTLKNNVTGSESLKDELRNFVVKEIGALARPDEIRFATMLPKTRSGKIMRRLLRNVAENVEIKGDVSTLEDLSVLQKLQSGDEE